MKHNQTLTPPHVLRRFAAERRRAFKASMAAFRETGIRQHRDNAVRSRILAGQYERLAEAAEQQLRFAPVPSPAPLTTAFAV